MIKTKKMYLSLLFWKHRKNYQNKLFEQYYTLFYYPVIIDGSKPAIEREEVIEKQKLLKKLLCFKENFIAEYGVAKWTVMINKVIEKKKQERKERGRKFRLNQIRMGMERTDEIKR